jgi:hypothetical protein
MKKARPSSTTAMPIQRLLGEEASVEWVALESLSTSSTNPRVHPPDALEALKHSIRRFGWAAPILADKTTREIIAGANRHEAARALGLDKVPVVFVNADAESIKALRIADNRVAEMSTWDMEILIGELNELSYEASLATGFSAGEIAEMVAAANVINDASAMPDMEVDDGFSKQRFVIYLSIANEASWRRVIEMLSFGEKQAVKHSLTCNFDYDPYVERLADALGDSDA